MQSRLKEIINRYINDYEELERKLDEVKKKIEDIDVKLSLYKEVIKMIENGYENNNLENNKFYIDISLDTIYGNEDMLMEFAFLLDKLKSKYTNKANEVRSFVSKLYAGLHQLERYKNSLEEELQELKNQVTRQAKVAMSARKAKFSINNEMPILGYMYNDLNDIINHYKFIGILSSKEKLLCANDLEYYNTLLEANNSNDLRKKERIEATYNKIPDMLAMGYEVFKLPEVDDRRRDFLIKEYKSAKTQINNIVPSKNKPYEESLLEILEYYRNFIPNENEYNYILVSLIKSIQKELIAVYDLTLNADDSLKSKKDIVREYYNILKKYLITRKYYDEINEIVEVDLTEEETKEVQKQKKYIYAHTSSGNPNILSDMKDMPQEYYGKVKKLLEEYKTGTIGSGKVKMLVNNKRSRGFMELKDDQIRIVFKHIKDDVYCITGLFAKQANNDIPMYQELCGRKLPVTSTDTDEKISKHLANAEEVETMLYEIIDTKGRKNNR